MNEMALQERFERAVLAAGGMHPSAAVFQDLVRRYGESHRHYHTLEHIDACLVWLDWFSGCADHAEEVELSLWFHDSVYSLSGRDNETQSAELARTHLGSLGLGGAAIDRIARHIEGTESHAASDRDSALVVDLDLSILGTRPKAFDAFEQQIRREYAHVPEPVYRDARRGILQGFLSRPQLYVSPPIRAELEASARANLQRRIAELHAPRTETSVPPPELHAPGR
jgi:predicted metal-dependent HD superfamily phosphohydrolase